MSTPPTTPPPRKIVGPLPDDDKLMHLRGATGGIGECAKIAHRTISARRAFWVAYIRGNSSDFCTECVKIATPPSTPIPQASKKTKRRGPPG